VLVHGFSGSSLDMKLVESILKKYGGNKLRVLNSVANETDTEVDINELA